MHLTPPCVIIGVCLACGAHPPLFFNFSRRSLAGLLPCHITFISIVICDSSSFALVYSSSGQSVVGVYQGSERPAPLSLWSSEPFQEILTIIMSFLAASSLSGVEGWCTRPLTRPNTRLPPMRALPSDCGSHQFYNRLRSHRQRLEHLVNSGSGVTAAQLQPVVSELRWVGGAAGGGANKQIKCACTHRAWQPISMPPHMHHIRAYRAWLPTRNMPSQRGVIGHVPARTSVLSTASAQHRPHVGITCAYSHPPSPTQNPTAVPCLTCSLHRAAPPSAGK